MVSHAIRLSSLSDRLIRPFPFARCSSSNYIPRVTELVQHGYAEQKC